MQKITPMLWFDNNAEEAVNLYISVFNNSKISGNVSRFDEAGAKASGQKEGTVMTVPFQLMDINFVAINGGPYFKFNPSTSFYVILETEKEVNKVWDRLKEGGQILMEISKYDWSDRYGWLQDKYGLSWQISLGSKKDFGQSIIPLLFFTGQQFGKTEEAINYYKSIFKNSSIDSIYRYEPGEGGPDGFIKYAQFRLEEFVFAAMENNQENIFPFNEAISFVVNCNDQKEIDYYWDKLTEGGDEKAQMCGWLKDKFGLSWQVVPVELSKLLSDPGKAKQVMQVVLKSKKLNIEELRNASKKEMA